MSKHHQQSKHSKLPARIKVPAISKHLQCPICHPTTGGKGIQKWHYRVSGRTIRYAYSCDQCGHMWTIDSMIVPVPPKPEVQHMEPKVETR